MLFGGIFKIWSGGKSKARRIGILEKQIKLAKQAAQSNLNGSDGSDNSDNSDNTDNTENTTPGGDNSQPETLPGTLAIDRLGNATIDPQADTAFKNDKPGATTNLEGLEAFDSNNDGVIDITDADWHKFGVWNDENNNGAFDAGEFMTLDNLGIASIDLASGLSNGMLHITSTNGASGLLALAPTA